ncbi:MAG: Asp-tRNA(Asn)/Glu-tRNA(Gln) amidotransferase subunit GatA [Alphaproteobacteria bacterium]|nr:Asp-tRNA(Asn)/Glu-tRNA(Gln) amidotransferase subunit GatA [Rickettsiales bacterium]
MFNSISKIKEQLKSKKSSIQDVVDKFYKEAKKNKYNQFITVCSQEYVNKQIQKSQKMLDDGTPRELEGVPIAVKDNICVADVKTTAASKMLANFIPNYTAEVVSRLTDAGCIIVGKTNMDEFGMGVSSENSAFGVITNPNVNPKDGKFNLNPGGSSGGSAVSTACGSSLISLGTDTGGSVRQPAALCGVYGMKPTYGLMSRHGVIAYSSSLDQVGVIGKSAADIGLLFNQMYGFDEKDSTTILDVKSRLGSFTDQIGKPVSNYSFATLDSSLLEGSDKQTLLKIEEVCNVCTELGMKRKREINFDYFHLAPPTYYSISTAECFSNFSRYDGIRYGHRSDNQVDNINDIYIANRTEGLGDEVKKRIAVGAMNLINDNYKDYFIKATKVRMLLMNEMTEVLEKNDIIIAPVIPSCVDIIGKEKDQVSLCLSDRFTFPVSCCGLPAITIPFGKTKDGFLVGVQLISLHLRDDILIQVADAIAKITQ